MVHEKEKCDRTGPLGNPRQIPSTTSDLGRIIVIHMRLRQTFVMRSVDGVPHRETPTRFL